MIDWSKVTSFVATENGGMVNKEAFVIDGTVGQPFRLIGPIFAQAVGPIFAQAVKNTWLIRAKYVAQFQHTWQSIMQPTQILEVVGPTQMTDREALSIAMKLFDKYSGPENVVEMSKIVKNQDPNTGQFVNKYLNLHLWR